MSARLDAIAESQLSGGDLPRWIDQLQPASFRGVVFHVDTVEWTAGDNVVLREYPFQDLPTVFRMGAGVQEIKFSAYVIGEDYHLQRAALMSALSGEGMLMHPTAGAMRVFVAGKFVVREAPTAEGGMARFDLHFVRADARRFPVGVVSTPELATAKAEAAKAAAVDSFAAEWQVARKPGWVAEQAVGRLRTSLDRVIGPIRKAAAGLSGFVADVNSAYRTAVDGLESLLAEPRRLAEALRNVFQLPADLRAAAPRDFQAAFSGLFNLKDTQPRAPFEVSVMPALGAGLVMYGTGEASAVASASVGQQEIEALSAAGDRLIETLAIAAYVQATAAVDLQSYDEAMAMRAVVHAQLVRMLKAGSLSTAAAVTPATSWHDALLVLHGVALADLQARSRDLVRLTSYTPESWQPVWYVSYRLYGTAAYADEILAMNPHIQHPLLVPPGRPLRVVRHD